jgi:hypothetical protein
MWLLSFIMGFTGGFMMGLFSDYRMVIRTLYDIKKQDEVSVEKISATRAVLSYTLNGLQYKILLRLKRGPKNIQLILTGEGVDVTEKVRPYLGPSEDCHQTPLTPGCLGYDTLVFQLKDGIHVYCSDQAI